MNKYLVFVWVLTLCLQEALAGRDGIQICIFASMLCKNKPTSPSPPRANCPKNCPDVEKFVCGTDGNSYQNKCFLKRASCEQEKRISVAYNYACSKEEDTAESRSSTKPPFYGDYDAPSEDQLSKVSVPSETGFKLPRRVLPRKSFN